MKRLFLAGLLLAAGVAGLAAACAGSSDDDTSPPDATATATTAHFDADQVITMTREFSVLYKVDHPDGTFELKTSTMDERVDLVCADEPLWSAQDQEREWRVYAECRREESASSDATPPPYGFETLSFVWLFYPNTRQVMPVSQAAHDAQYPFPQPTTIPTIGPLPTLTP